MAHATAISMFCSYHLTLPLLIYQATVVLFATILTFIITCKYFALLPTWTNIQLKEMNTKDLLLSSSRAEHAPSRAIPFLFDSVNNGIISSAVIAANALGGLVVVSTESGNTIQRSTSTILSYGFTPRLPEDEFMHEVDDLVEISKTRTPLRQRSQAIRARTIFSDNNSLKSND